MIISKNKKLLLISLLSLVLFFTYSTAYAAIVEAPTNIPNEVGIDQQFQISSTLSDVQPGQEYYVKCRIGSSSSNLNEGQTYNSVTDTWLSDNKSWKEMPVVKVSQSTENFSLTCKIKANSSEGQKIIYVRACLKEADGSCNESFQSESGVTITARFISPTPSTIQPTPSPTPTINASTPTKTPFSFKISSLPSSINVDQSFPVSVEITGLWANSIYYLKGAFVKEGSSNYFGKTKVYENWIKNNQSYSSQYKVTTDNTGSYTGTIEVMVDSNDSGFVGEGTYLFKVGYYNSLGSGPTWSNPVEVLLKTSSLPPTPQTTQPTDKVVPQVLSSTKDNQEKLYDQGSPPQITIPNRLYSKEASNTDEIRNNSLGNVKISKKIQPFVLFAGFGLILTGISIFMIIYKKKRL